MASDKTEFLSLPNIHTSNSCTPISISIDVSDILKVFIDNCREAPDGDDWELLFVSYRVYLDTLRETPSFTEVVKTIRKNYTVGDPRGPLLLSKGFYITYVTMTVRGEEKQVLCLVPFFHNLSAITHYTLRKNSNFNVTDHGKYFIPLGVPKNDNALERIRESKVCHCSCQSRFADRHDTPCVCLVLSKIPDRAPRRSNVLEMYEKNSSAFFKVAALTLENAMGLTETVHRDVDKNIKIFLYVGE